MKQYFALIIALFVYSQLQAQSSHICADFKSQMANKAKPTRAATSDNALMNQYDVKYYFLELNTERDTLYIEGATTILSEVTAAQIDTFAVELNAAHTVDSILYNNQPILFTHSTNHMVYGYLPASVLKGTMLNIKIYYHGVCASTNSAIGYGYNTKASPSWGNEVTWSLSQPYVAFDWFPCKQFLQDKADSSAVYITTSIDNKAGSNGILAGIDTIGNKVRYRWKNNQVINYYLISVAVAKYVDYSYYAHLTNGDSVLMQNYVYDNPGTLPNFLAQIDTVGQFVTYFDSLLVAYPYKDQKYGHCMAPFSGGMEHQTMTSLGFFTFGIDAHELMHQWFGDYVTCSTWSDIFINEGFASYGEYLAEERFRGNTAKKSLMQSVHTNVMSQPGGSIYFTDTLNSNRIFDSRLSYDKGNAVIHTLRFVLGENNFFTTLRNFLNQYGDSNAGIDDLKVVAQNVSGKNLDTFFNQWIYGAGYPTFSIEYNSNGSVATVKVNHTVSSTTPTFVTPLELTLKSTSGDTVVIVNTTTNSDVFVIPTTKIINGVTVDPNNWLLNKVGSITNNPNLYPTGVSTAYVTPFVSISPNPANNVVIIKNSMPSYEMLITDVTGKILVHKLDASYTESIDISTWPNGMYLYKCFVNGSSPVVQKLIVVK